MDSSTYKIIKYIVLVSNLLVVLLGLILLGIGVWTVVDFETFSSVFGTNQILFQDASIITIVAGSVITLIGVLGCVAAREDSNFLLGVYFVIVLVLVMLELSGLIIAFSFNTNTNLYLEPLATSTITSHYRAETVQGALSTSAWDTLQRRFLCCGYNNGSDYAGSFYDSINFNFRPWPASCCTVTAAGGYVDLASCISDDPVITSNTNAAQGCVTALVEIFREYAIAIGATSAVFIGIEIAVMVLTCIMFIKADELA